MFFIHYTDFISLVLKINAMNKSYEITITCINLSDWLRVIWGHEHIEKYTSDKQMIGFQLHEVL